MNKPTLISLSAIRHKDIRDFILDYSLTDKSSIYLSQFDFDELALEHRNIYNTSLTIPYILIGVLIIEDTRYRIPRGRIGYFMEDEYREEYIRSFLDPENEDDNFEIIYRCGYCGNIVNQEGNEIDYQTGKRQHERLVSKYNNYRTELKHGHCCRGKQY